MGSKPALMRRGMPVLRLSSRRAARASGAEAAAGGMISAAPLVIRSSWSATGGNEVWDSVGMRSG